MEVRFRFHTRFFLKQYPGLHYKDLNPATVTADGSDEASPVPTHLVYPLTLPVADALVLTQMQHAGSHSFPVRRLI